MHTKTLRDCFYSGLAIVLALGVFLIWLWQPQRQVRRHSENFLRACEAKDWPRLAGFIAPEYQDQWHNDRAVLLERTQVVFRYLRNVRLTALAPAIEIDNSTAHWRATIIIDGEAGEVMALVKERVNLLTTAFDLQWRHASAKPWDWKLVRVSNSELVLPEYTD